MNTTPGDAKAQAAAAKAYAKAQRPFYKKKRFWLFVLIVVIIIGAVAGGSKKNNSASSNNGVASQSSNGSHPPQADVRITGCTYDPSTTFATANLTITNHSSKRSNYLIGVDFTNSAGVQLASTDAGGGDNVDPGQKAIVQAVDTLSAPADRLTCTIKSVDRYAS